LGCFALNTVLWWLSFLCLFCHVLHKNVCLGCVNKSFLKVIMLGPKLVEFFLGLILQLKTFRVFTLEKVYTSLHSSIFGQNSGTFILLAISCIFVNSSIIEVIVISFLTGLSYLVSLQNPELCVLNITLGHSDSIFGDSFSLLWLILLIFCRIVFVHKSINVINGSILSFTNLNWCHGSN